MRLQAVKRSNPYIEEGVEHKPKQNTSPYEKTLETLFRPMQNLSNLKPLELKFCKHCSFNIKLSSSGAAPITDSYPSATSFCRGCSSDICDKCVRICDRCQRPVCYVCSKTVFETNETLNICPDC